MKKLIDILKFVLVVFWPIIIYMFIDVIYWWITNNYFPNWTYLILISFQIGWIIFAYIAIKNRL